MKRPIIPWIIHKHAMVQLLCSPSSDGVGRPTRRSDEGASTIAGGCEGIQPSNSAKRHPPAALNSGGLRCPSLIR